MTSPNDTSGGEPVVTVVIEKKPGISSYGWFWETTSSAAPFHRGHGYTFSRWGARREALRSARQLKLHGTRAAREEFTL